MTEQTADVETPYECSVCHEIRKYGSFSEHDDEWICDGCHADLSRGGDLSPETIAAVQEGLAQAERGETHYLGSFAQYLDEDGDNE